MRVRAYLSAEATALPTQYTPYGTAHFTDDNTAHSLTQHTRQRQPTTDRDIEPRELLRPVAVCSRPCAPATRHRRYKNHLRIMAHTQNCSTNAAHNLSTH